MGGSMMDDDWELTAVSNSVSTLVLVGRTGNGKSATGNSILGWRAFNSKTSSSSVTTTCELQRTVLKDGRIVNVIDTPGLFDSSVESDFIGKEIVRCINLSKDGIHAVLVVLSVRNRFTNEEVAAFQSLQTLFGEKILSYMIIVFTGGDELESNDETLKDYLGRDCPESLQELLHRCKNRIVLFDNRTKDEVKKVEQLQQLFSLVDIVIAENGGQPYSNEFFLELKEGAVRLFTKKEEYEAKGYSNQEILVLKEQMERAYDAQLERITEMVESKLRETTQRLEQQLAAEQSARIAAERIAMEAQMKSSDEIRQLRESLEVAKRETEDLRKRAEGSKCAIL